MLHRLLLAALLVILSTVWGCNRHFCYVGEKRQKCIPSRVVSFIKTDSSTSSTAVVTGLITLKDSIGKSVNIYPAEGATILFIPTNSYNYSAIAMTNSSGKFKVEVAPNNYTIQIAYLARTKLQIENVVLLGGETKDLHAELGPCY